MKWSRLAALTLCYAVIAPIGAPADDPPKPTPPVKAKKRPRVAPQDWSKFRYRGITIDVSALADYENPESNIASLRRQIDIVADVKTRPEIADFFLKVTTTLGPVPGGGPGFCSGRFVVMTPEVIPPDRVVLLHEFLHAWHGTLKPEAQRELTKYHQQALHAYGLAPTEYFLTNVGEFFAVTASIYLHGQIPRPPATRQAIQRAQPEYYRFLASLFDPKSAAEQGPAPNALPPSRSPGPQSATNPAADQSNRRTNP